MLAGLVSVVVLSAFIVLTALVVLHRKGESTRTSVDGPAERAIGQFGRESETPSSLLDWDLRSTLDPEKLAEAGREVEFSLNCVSSAELQGAGPGEVVVEVLRVDDRSCPVVTYEKVASSEVDEFLEAARAEPDVVAADLVIESMLAVETSDPFSADQWALDLLDASDLWAAWPADAEVTIAVLDSGVHRAHPDFDSSLVSGDGERGSHGTAVSSVIAAQSDNGVDIAGLAPQARILSIAIHLADHPGGISIADAVLRATGAGAEIINISAIHQQPSEVEEAAIALATEAGVVVVASVGNCGTDPIRNHCSVHDEYSYPAGYAWVLGVGSIEEDLDTAAHSSANESVDLVAPGQSVVALNPYSAPDFKSGTSIAAPYVSAVAAIIRANYPDLDSMDSYDLQILLRGTARDLGPPGVDVEYGYGLIDPQAALDARSTWGDVVDENEGHQLAWRVLASTSEIHDFRITYPQLGIPDVDAVVETMATQFYENMLETATSIVDDYGDLCTQYPTVLRGRYNIAYLVEELVTLNGSLYTSYCGGVPNDYNPVANLRTDGSPVDLAESIHSTSGLRSAIDAVARDEVFGYLGLDGVNELRLGARPEGLSVHFSDSEIGAGAAGAPVLSIPWDNLVPLLVDGSPLWSVATGEWISEEGVGFVSCSEEHLLKVGVTPGSETYVGVVADWFDPKWHSACSQALGLASWSNGEANILTAFSIDPNTGAHFIGHYAETQDLFGAIVSLIGEYEAAVAHLDASGAGWLVP